VQNAEQTNETLWQRLLSNGGLRAADELYKLYSAGIFDTLEVDETTDPELFKFVEETKTKGPKFTNYTHAKAEKFVRRIYELRKN
jgi:hypothetical protein